MLFERFEIQESRYPGGEGEEPNEDEYEHGGYAGDGESLGVGLLRVLIRLGHGQVTVVGDEGNMQHGRSAGREIHDVPEEAHDRIERQLAEQGVDGGEGHDDEAHEQVGDGVGGETQVDAFLALLDHDAHEHDQVGEHVERDYEEKESGEQREFEVGAELVLETLERELDRCHVL